MKKSDKFILCISLILGAFAFAEPNSSEKPNVLFITIDALKLEHLTCYGYERDTSFNINRLAKEGTLFRQAIA